MFYVTARVGTMFAIYDDTDNSVEWYDKIQLDDFYNKGINIKGYSPQSVYLRTNLQCPFNFCNWTKTKRNIFDVASRVIEQGDTITIIAEGKKYKCKIYDYNNHYYFVKFSNGLHVKIPYEWLNKFNGGAF